MYFKKQILRPNFSSHSAIAAGRQVGCARSCVAVDRSVDSAAMSRRGASVCCPRKATQIAAWVRLGACLVGLIGLAVSVAAHAENAAIGPTPTREFLPLSAVRPGMTGHGLTVFSGTRPERFSVRVIGVLRQFQPQLDIILIQSDDERLKHSGIAAGMSGSPIYLEGKLAGALAYGWSFAKDPIAGVTPIDNIVRELRRPSRPSPSPAPIAAIGDQRAAFSDMSPALPPHAPSDDLRRALLQQAWADGDRPALRRLRSSIVGTTGVDDRVGPQLQRVSLPLSVAGLGTRAIEDLRGLLAPYGLLPLQASGGGGTVAASTDAGFVEGGAIAVQLARGDVTMNGTGTVTYLEGSRVAAFGHPMLGVGDVRLPVATAEVVTFLPSQSMSFKMSMPLSVQGSLVQDRPSCIVADTSLRAPILPFDLRVATAPATQVGIESGLLGTAVGSRSTNPLSHKSFHVDLAQHRLLTPMLLAVVSSNAVNTVVPDVAEAVVEIRSRLHLRGFAPIEQSDFLFSTEGVTTKMVNNSTGVRQVQELFNNPFGPVNIDRMELSIGVSFRSDVAEIVGISVPGDELEPDSRPSLQVTLRPYAGPLIVRSIPIDVPRWLAGQALKIEVQAGHQVKPEQAPPESLSDFVDNLRRVYSARTLVVTLNTLEEGVMLRGRLVPALPASVMATLRPAGGSRRGEPYKRVGRQLIDLDSVLSGKQELTVLVRDEVR